MDHLHPANPPADSTRHQLTTTPAVQRDLLLAEYESLRTEILKLIELQSQFLAVTVVAFGTIASLGFQTKNSRLLLIHPVVALILGILWMNNAHSICRCAKYLRRVEKTFAADGFGWERFVEIHHHPHWWIGFWGVRAMFAVSAVLAVLASLAIGIPHGIGWPLFAASVLVTVLVIVLSLWWRERPYDEVIGPAGRATSSPWETPGKSRRRTTNNSMHVIGGSND